MAASKARVAPAPAPDPVKYEPVMIAVGKIRALAWTLEQLADEDTDGANGLLAGVLEGPEDTRGWLVQTIGDALQEELATIEQEYRKVRAGVEAVA